MRNGLTGLRTRTSEAVRFGLAIFGSQISFDVAQGEKADDLENLARRMQVVVPEVGITIADWIPNARRTLGWLKSRLTRILHSDQARISQENLERSVPVDPGYRDFGVGLIESTLQPVEAPSQ